MNIITPGCASREPQLQGLGFRDSLRETSRESDSVGLQSHSLE